AVYLKVIVASGSAVDAQKRYDASLQRQLAGVYNNLGTALAGLHDLGGAVQAYRVAIAGDPDSATSQFNLALTLADQGNLAEAQRYLDETVRLKPDLLEAHLKLGQIMLSQGRADLAKLHLRKASHSADPNVAKAAVALLASVN